MNKIDLWRYEREKKNTEYFILFKCNKCTKFEIEIQKKVIKVII